MNKRELKQSLQAAIDHAWAVSKMRIDSMQSDREHPQVALCIEKNKGYMLALEDVTEMLYAHKVF